MPILNILTIILTENRPQEAFIQVYILIQKLIPGTFPVFLFERLES